MKTFTKDELQGVLARHFTWLIGGQGGERANLRGADLCGADLCGASGNLKHLKSVFLDTYQIAYTASVMQIGCQRHDIAAWWAFSDAEIRNMDGEKALEWWHKYKPLLQQIIALSPAEPTKTEAEQVAA